MVDFSPAPVLDRKVWSFDLLRLERERPVVERNVESANYWLAGYSELLAMNAHTIAHYLDPAFCYRVRRSDLNTLALPPKVYIVRRHTHVHLPARFTCGLTAFPLCFPATSTPANVAICMQVQPILFSHRSVSEFGAQPLYIRLC